MTVDDRLRDLAREARELHETRYAEWPIVGGPDTPEEPVAELVSVVRQRALRLPDRDVVYGLLIAEALGLLMRSGTAIVREGTYAAWKQLELVKARRVSDDALDAILKLINAEILRPIELEWTAHGLKRTFRFWSPEEQVTYLTYSNEVVADLSASFEQVCYAYGTVLSMVRTGGQLISHDDDVDLLVALPSKAYPDFDSGLESITEVLEAAGHDVRQGEGMMTHRWVSRSGTRPVDVFVGIAERGEVAAFPGPRWGLKSADLFPARAWRIHALEVLVPRDARTYVRKVYGPDWKTPRIVYTHRGGGWRDFEDLQRGGRRHGRLRTTASRWRRRSIDG